MVSIVVPQPHRPTASTAESPVSENGDDVLSFSVSNVSAERIALVTPRIQPLEPLTSPLTLPGKLEKTAGVSVSVPDAAMPSDQPPAKPAVASKDTTDSLPTSPKRVNKFVRRLYNMLQAEKHSGIVEWRRGLLVLHSTDRFAKQILPRYFNTKNFKTLRRQLNYYGFVHVRSFSTTGCSTTALWCNQDLAKRGTDDISSVLMLKRVDHCESAKTAEERRRRKQLAASTVEDDIGVSAKSLQLEQIRSMARRTTEHSEDALQEEHANVPLLIHCHGANFTQTTLEGGPFGSSRTWFTPNYETSSSSAVESSDSSQHDDDDAANLLLALSKSNVAS